MGIEWVLNNEPILLYVIFEWFYLMRYAMFILTLLLLSATSGCIGYGDKEGPDVYWIDVTATYSAEHNESTEFLMEGSWPGGDHCSIAYRDGNTGIFQTDEVASDSNLVILTKYPGAGSSHWNTLTQTFSDEEMIWKGQNLTFEDEMMRFGNQTLAVGETITSNFTFFTSGFYDEDGDGYGDLWVEDAVLITEKLVISYQGKIPTKATGSYPCM